VGWQSGEKTNVRSADGRRAQRDGAEGVYVQLVGRHETFTAIVEPRRKSALLGAIVLEDFPEAEPLLVAGQKGLAERRDKIPVPERESTLHDSIDRLVRLYEPWNKPAEAEKWKQL